jgi:hypothetical protein
MYARRFEARFRNIYAKELDLRIGCCQRFQQMGADEAGAAEYDYALQLIWQLHAAFGVHSNHPTLLNARLSGEIIPRH